MEKVNILKALVDNKKDAKIKQNISADALKLLQSHLLSTSLPLIILMTTLVFYTLYPISDFTLLLSWYICALSIVLLRSGFLVAYEHFPQNYQLHHSLFIIGSTLHALLWGIAGSVLMPKSNILDQATLIVIIAGICAGSTQVLQANLTANVLHICITLVPVSIRLLLFGSQQYFILSFSIFIYMIFMIFIAIRGHKSIAESLRLRHENLVLVEELKSINKNLNTEIQERKKIENQLQHLATHDTLTGLANRSYVDTLFKRALARAKRYNYHIGILYLDLDGFKDINDTYGHQIGDLLLSKVAERLEASVRTNDIVARLGGDEFLMILETLPESDIILTIANKIQSQINEPFEIESQQLYISTSIGISTYPLDGHTGESLIKHADTRLYKAKTSGKNKFEFY